MNKKESIKSTEYISLTEASVNCKYSQEYLSLRARQGKLKAVKFLKGKEVVIDASNDVVAHIDGEYFSNPPFNIKILPNHLLFRLPH